MSRGELSDSALRSARVSVLEECLTPQTFVRDGDFTSTNHE